MDKQQAKQILMTGIPADQVAEANAVYYGTGGVYEHDVAAQASLVPPASPPYAAPPSFPLPDIEVTYVAGLFDLREYMDQLNYKGYILQINGRNSAAFNAYLVRYKTWRTNVISRNIYDDVPVPPAFEVPAPYSIYKPWFDQSSTGTSTAPPETTQPPFAIPTDTPFDYEKMIAARQKVAPTSSLGTDLKQS